jgi:hypothetical protein
VNSWLYLTQMREFMPDFEGVADADEDVSWSGSIA